MMETKDVLNKQCSPRRVVRNYVPRTLYPSTSETMYPVLAKPCTMYRKLETMYLVPWLPCTYIRNLAKKWNNPNIFCFISYLQDRCLFTRIIPHGQTVM